MNERMNECMNQLLQQNIREGRLRTRENEAVKHKKRFLSSRVLDRDRHKSRMRRRMPRGSCDEKKRREGEQEGSTCGPATLEKQHSRQRKHGISMERR